MTLLDLVASLRRRLYDMGGDRPAPPAGYSYSWEADDTTCLLKNGELVGFLAEAEREFCRRRPLRDRSTMSVTAGTSSYRLPGHILAIQSVVPESGGATLLKVTQEDLDAGFVASAPCSAYREDARNGRIEFLSAPTTTQRFVLAVDGLPDVTLEWADRQGIPSIGEPWHAALVDYAAYLAYSVRDFENYDPVAAERAALAFDRAVGPARSAVDSEWTRRLANRHPRTRATFF